MSADEQVTNQAEELGRMLASSGSFANVAKAIARGFAEAQTGEAQRRAHLALLGAEALVKGSETARGWVVQDARDVGISWSAIGRALEISKQGAQQRYGTRDSCTDRSQRHLIVLQSRPDVAPAVSFGLVSTRNRPQVTISA